MNIKRQVKVVQDEIKKLHSMLKEEKINFDEWFEEMIEALAFISGYADKSLEKAEE